MRIKISSAKSRGFIAALKPTIRTVKPGAMPDGATMGTKSGRLGRVLNDSVKVSFSSKPIMSQKFEIESTHHLAPTKSNSTNIQWKANGAPRAKFSLQTIGAQVASPSVSQQSHQLRLLFNRESS